MSQLSLLDAGGPACDVFDIPDADVRLERAAFAAAEASELFAALRVATRWRQDTIKFYGKEFKLPRLQQWHGDADLIYTWSGIEMRPEPWTSPLLLIKARVEQIARTTFNTVLLNLYRSGKDTVSWHTDDEKELGESPTIASVSLGAERDFVLRHATRKDVADVLIPLPHGSLLVMAGSTQRCWKHCLPRRQRVSSERINLTFRRVLTPADRRSAS